MIGIEINEKPLDLSADTALRIELNSTAYFGQDESVLPGAFTYPFTIGATSANVQALGHVFSLDDLANDYWYDDARIFIGGVLCFRGRAELKDITPISGKLTIYITDFLDIKDRPINEFDYGGVRALGTDRSEQVDHMIDTANNPDDYDYIFFPIYNPDYVEDDDNGEDWRNWQNPKGFIEDPHSGATMPFVKLDYAVTRILAESKFSVNIDIDESDWTRICLYNNYSIYIEENQWSEEFNLANHVSKTKAGNFLKKYFRLFNLMIDYNWISRTLDVIPAVKLFEAEMVDWTEKALDLPTKTEREETYRSWEYEPNSNESGFNDRILEEFNADYQGEVQSEEDIPAAVSGDPITYWYVIDKDLIFISLYLPVVGARIIPSPLGINFIKKIGEGPRYTSQIRCLRNNASTAVHGDLVWPTISQPGTIPYRDQAHDFPDAITIYRGQFVTEGFLNPYANHHNYDPDGNEIGDLSLSWIAEKGIWNTYWKTWAYMLYDRKEVEWGLQLTLSDIVNFRFRRRYRIGNQTYVCKKIELNVTMQGIQPAIATMVSIKS